MPLSGEKTLLKYLQTGILVISRKGEIVYMNPASRTLLNLEPKENYTLNDIFGNDARHISLWLENSRRHGGYFLEIERGGRHLRLMPYPIIEDEKDLGTIVEIFDVTDWQKTIIDLKENAAQLKKRLNELIKKEIPSFPESKINVVAKEIENMCSIAIKTITDRKPESFDVLHLLKEHMTLLSKSLPGAKIYTFIPQMLPPVFSLKSALNECMAEILSFIRENGNLSRPLMFTAKPGDTGEGLYVLISHAFFLSNGGEKTQGFKEKLENIVASGGGFVKILRSNKSLCVTIMVPSS